uniref:Uncharacterized protein n=1 Tax=Romanomermis culicivorax TaxID=13658 RepID=A0A915J0K8_ROMCU
MIYDATTSINPKSQNFEIWKFSGPSLTLVSKSSDVKLVFGVPKNEFRLQYSKYKCSIKSCDKLLTGCRQDGQDFDLCSHCDRQAKWNARGCPRSQKSSDFYSQENAGLSQLFRKRKQFATIVNVKIGASFVVQIHFIQSNIEKMNSPQEFKSSIPGPQNLAPQVAGKGTLALM